MKHYPRMFQDEEACAIGKPDSLKEIKVILSWFDKDKSHGPDGCPPEFFIGYFDLVGRIF